ncbi:MAG: carboxypeptidase-like regulatory domain-containing protein [Bacteroidia bacterium]
MKKYIVALILFLSIAFNSIGANDNKNNESKRLITGKVIDKQTGEEIVGAEIKIENTTIYSDLKGNFLTNVASKTITATIEAISYNQSIITLETNHFTGELVIALESK